MPEFKHNIELRKLVNSRMSQFERVEQSTKNLTRAAVVLGISKQGINACLLLTQRSSNLRKHAGQYALPGGKVDLGETLEQAALRELSEELNLTPSKENIIGLLDDFPTQSGFCITPVVVWIDDHTDLAASPDEVAAVYEIPLRELASVELDQDQEAKHTVMSIYLPSVGNSIYSPTAAIMYQFREVILHGRTTRVTHFGQPKFAWR